MMAAGLAAAGPASADPALSSEYASRPLPACRIDPFANLGAQQRESLALNDCGGDHTRLFVESPRPVFNQPETRYSRAEFGTLATRNLWGLLSTVRFSWSGVRDQATGRARSDSALLAAGGLLRVYDDVDVQMNVGRQIVGVPTTRATFSGSWRPTSRSLLYTEWTGTPEPGTDARRVGALWWLVPRRLALDFGFSRHDDSQGWTLRRIGLTFTGMHF